MSVNDNKQADILEFESGNGKPGVVGDMAQGMAQFFLEDEDSIIRMYKELEINSGGIYFAKCG